MSREQVADGAGFSLSQLRSIEQGERGASEDFIAKFIARMGLSDAEAQHLWDLFHPPHVSSAEEDGRHTVLSREQLERIHAPALGSVLAAYVDEGWNVIECNAEYSRLFRHIDAPEIGNVLAWFFFVEDSKKVMLEWEDEARLTVAWLRSHMARRRGDPRFERILSMLDPSPEFRRMWEYGEVHLGRHKPHFLLHDLDRGVNMTLNAQVWPEPNPSQALQMYQGVPIG